MEDIIKKEKSKELLSNNTLVYIIHGDGKQYPNFFFFLKMCHVCCTVLPKEFFFCQTIVFLRLLFIQTFSSFLSFSMKSSYLSSLKINLFRNMFSLDVCEQNIFMIENSVLNKKQSTCHKQIVELIKSLKTFSVNTDWKTNQHDGSVFGMM